MQKNIQIFPPDPSMKATKSFLQTSFFYQQTSEQKVNDYRPLHERNSKAIKKSLSTLFLSYNNFP
jgi:hypothetical protein